MTRNTLLLILGVLTLGLSTVAYARLKPRPLPWREEQRRRARLSAVLDGEGCG